MTTATKTIRKNIPLLPMTQKQEEKLRSTVRKCKKCGGKMYYYWFMNAFICSKCRNGEYA